MVLGGLGGMEEEREEQCQKNTTHNRKNVDPMLIICFKSYTSHGIPQSFMGSFSFNKLVFQKRNERIGMIKR